MQTQDFIVDTHLSAMDANVATPEEYTNILRALTTSGSERLAILREAFADRKLHDSRFLEAILDALDDRNASVADYIAETVLPSFGVTILPQVKSKLDVKGKLAHARRLRLMYRLDPCDTRPFVEKGLEIGSDPVKVAAISCLEDREKDWEVLLESVRSSEDRIRRAAYHALCRIGNDRANSILRGVLDSDDAPALVEHLTLFVNPPLVSQARTLVRTELSQLVGVSYDPSQFEHPRLIAHMRIAASIADRESVLLLIDCLRTSQAMIELNRWCYDIHSTAIELLIQGDDESFQMLLDCRKEIPVVTIGTVFVAARSRLSKADVYEIFSPYLRESNAHGRTREHHSYREIEKTIEGSVEDHFSVDPEVVFRNKDLDPRWIDVAIQQDLKRVVLSIVVPGYRAAWEYLLNCIDEFNADNLIIFQGNTYARLGLLRFEYPEAEDLCLAEVERILAVEDDSLQPAFDLISLLSPKAIPKMEAFKNRTDCTETHREWLSKAIQQIRKNHRHKK